jgi:hypothetical protein
VRFLNGMSASEWMDGGRFILLQEMIFVCSSLSFIDEKTTS